MKGQYRDCKERERHRSTEREHGRLGINGSTYQYISIFIEESQEFLQTPHTTFQAPVNIIMKI